MYIAASAAAVSTCAPASAVIAAVAVFLLMTGDPGDWLSVESHG